jgi:hypothetical protein
MPNFLYFLLKPSQINVKFIMASDPNEENMSQFLKLIFLKRPSIIVAQSEVKFITQILNKQSFFWQFRPLKDVYCPTLNQSLKVKPYRITNVQTRIENECTIHTLEFLNMDVSKNKLCLQNRPFYL